MDNFFQPAPINSGPGHLDRLLATWFESNISLAQVARNLCITFTSLLEYVGRPEVRRAIQQARQLMHERYSDTGLELLHEAAQDFKALKGLPENPTPADKDRQRATLNGMRQVAALLAGLTPRRATRPRAPRTNSTQDNSAPYHATPSESTTHDRALDHFATPPLLLNYLASSAPEPAPVPEPIAPDRALCHSTTSPLLPTTLPEPTAPHHALCHSTTWPLLPSPRARSPSQAIAA